MDGDNIYRRMTRHDAERIKRLTIDRGHFANCRHYQKTSDRTFICDKHGTRRNCEGCMTCPNCGGLMYTYRRRSETTRDSLWITHAKSCMLCGAYIEHQYAAFIEKKREKKPEGKCQVHGCTHIAWKAHEEGSQTFQICVIHANRIKSWRQHPTKTEQHKPIMAHNGELIENPEYMIKQGKRK